MFFRAVLLYMASGSFYYEAFPRTFSFLSNFSGTYFII